MVVIDQGGDIFDNFAECRARDFGFVFVLRVYQTVSGSGMFPKRPCGSPREHSGKDQG